MSLGIFSVKNQFGKAGISKRHVYETMDAFLAMKQNTSDASTCAKYAL